MQALLALNMQGLLLRRGAWQACTMTGVPLHLHHMQGHHRAGPGKAGLQGCSKTDWSPPYHERLLWQMCSLHPR